MTTPATPPKARLRAYGLSEEDWDNLLVEQYDRCAICKRPFTQTRTPRIDHDHDTGEVRGLLCNGCNQRLGYLSDSADWVAGAHNYYCRPPAHTLFDPPRRHKDAPPKETR